MVNVKAPPAPGGDEPVRCPICGGTVVFRLLVAEIRSIPYRQTHAHRWRRMRSDPVSKPRPTAIGCICDGCAHLMPIPASLLAAFNKRTRPARW